MTLKCGHGKVMDYYHFGIFIYELIFGIPPFYHKNKDKMVANILTKKVHFPFKISLEL